VLWASELPNHIDIVAVPIQALTNPCQNPRYPRILEDYILGCGLDGKVDRAFRFKDGIVTKLPHKENWAEGERIFRTGSPGGLWDPQKEMFQGGRFFGEGVAAKVQYGFIAVLSSDYVAIGDLAKVEQYRRQATPIGWAPPVLLKGIDQSNPSKVAWIEWSSNGMDVVIWEWNSGTEPVRLSTDRALSLVGEGQDLWWTEANSIEHFNLNSGLRSSISARSAQSLYIRDGVLCWSAWAISDLDVFCNDGFHLEREGHQEWPQLHESGLYFSERGRLMWLVQ
jgi:hypothetical protein